MNWDELRDLDLRDVHLGGMGDWSWIGKGILVALIIVIVLVGGYFIVIRKQLDTLDQARQTEVTLRHKFKQKQPLAANLEAYQAQLKLMHKKFDKLLQQLPSRTEIDSLLADVSQTAKEDGLSQKLFQPGAEKKREFYVLKPIKMAYTGSWEQISKFVSDVSSLPRIVTLRNFQLHPEKKSDSGTDLAFTVTAETYSYRSDLDDGKKKGHK
jgi:type IV pilus assembly protein PilO